ncbi:hypothetical protein [Evansella cellulosilytica]|uniref:Uncharacterized protein n=1 Tax=Evansella cellulosilytica (strain ATCC 21833 / DSM 2522 / FERM P-1141 / JCM 9156 / N-4) TaxID=649639 RepID=E6TXD1_EVAC2|nr:hypothetical protein [Evansella cellulosilytica]ADU32326.1 hypothetical protein Bcell_4096 [Evansella cellulosilytica DSM 2522]
MKYTLIGMTLLLFVMTGCNENLDNPEVGGMNTEPGSSMVKDWGESFFGPGPANYGAIEEHNAPSDPNTETNTTGKSYRDPVKAHQTEEDDHEMIENIVHNTPGVTPGMVMIVGSNAWVNVSFEERINGNVSSEQVREIERQLYEANPRYNYRVIVNDFR